MILKSVEIFLVLLVGLTVLIGAALFSRRTGVAAPLLLLAVGIGASLVPSIPNLRLEPEWILSGVLPPLLYASSVQMPVVDLRRNFHMITWLSIVMVIVGAVVIGLAVHAIVPAVPLPLAVALGAVVSPTDAVAATAIGKRLGLPPRIMTVLEGESLFNDAAALVTLSTATAALGASFSPGHAVGEFLWASVGGAAIGYGVGRLVVAVRQLLGDPVLTTAVSFAVPWIAFFAAEELHASGVLSVVVAGITSGHLGRLRLSAVERSTESITWATVNFLLENAVFLVMGLQISLLIDGSRADGGLQHVIPLTAVTFLVMVLVRVVAIAVPLTWQRLRPDRTTRWRERLSAYAERLREYEEQEQIDTRRAELVHRRLDQNRADLEFVESEPITRRGGVVLAWAGMRGVVTLAAAQTIPEVAGGHNTPYRSSTVLVAFAVAVVSLVVFGGTLPWVIRKLRFRAPSPGDERAEFIDLMSSLTDAVVGRIGTLTDQRINGKPVSEQVATSVQQRFAPLLAGRQEEIRRSEPDLREQSATLQRRYLTEFRLALAEEQTIGAYSTQTLNAAQRLLDREEQRLNWTG